MSLSDTIGFVYAPIIGSPKLPRGFTLQNGRDNDRTAIEDSNLADALWNRIKFLVPGELDGKRVIGLNERLRFYRYTAGQSFSPHTDGYYLRDNGERSLLTLLLNLNDNFSGGETRFLETEQLITPQQGQAMIFSHELWHEGLPVTAGYKYVLRTDVMYEGRANTL